MTINKKLLTYALLSVCTHAHLSAMENDQVQLNPNEVTIIFKNYQGIEFKKIVENFYQTLEKNNIPHNSLDEFIILDKNTPSDVFLNIINLHHARFKDAYNTYKQNSTKKNKITFQKIAIHLEKICNVVKNMKPICANQDIQMSLKDLDQTILDHYYPLQANHNNCIYNHAKADTFIKQNTITKVYCCTECNYLCYDKRNTRRHIKVLHLNEKQYQCNKCKKSFAYVQQLKKHTEKTCKVETQTSETKRKRSVIEPQTQNSETTEQKQIIIDKQSTGHIMQLRRKRLKLNE